MPSEQAKARLARAFNGYDHAILKFWQQLTGYERYRQEKEGTPNDWNKIVKPARDELEAAVRAEVQGALPEDVEFARTKLISDVNEWQQATFNGELVVKDWFPALDALIAKAHASAYACSEHESAIPCTACFYEGVITTHEAEVAELRARIAELEEEQT